MLKPMVAAAAPSVPAAPAESQMDTLMQEIISEAVRPGGSAGWARVSLSRTAWSSCAAASRNNGYCQFNRQGGISSSIASTA